jgi:hypothetical protein
MVKEKFDKQRQMAWNFLVLMTVAAMATILPFLKDQSVFGPEMTQAMSIAFDEVCLALKLPDQAVRERETVAVRIIEWARRGVRDPARLREQVLRDAGAGAA